MYWSWKARNKKDALFLEGVFLADRKKTRAEKARVFLSGDQAVAESFRFFLPNRWERLSITE